MSIDARLDKKTGKRVLCGVPSCRGQLGTLDITHPRGWGVDRPATARVEFGCGWVLREGVYRLGTHSVARCRQGKAPQYRRPSAKWETDSPFPPYILGYDQDAGPSGAMDDGLKAVCCVCGNLNSVDPDTLGIRWPVDPPASDWCDPSDFGWDSTREINEKSA
jgi:hypothetical protein